jgi:hypothetical protein
VPARFAINTFTLNVKNEPCSPPISFRSGAVRYVWKYLRDDRPRRRGPWRGQVPYS